MQLKQTTLSCPHCGHPMHVSLDCSNGDQDYFEDCPNCCYPVHLAMHIDDMQHKVQLTVLSDDEQVY
ncbi:CPXCG motif-containing cysteine-rich protein [Aestuariibacter halophilus]|uniref:CPXCG motif-containing cysteine-rich protein n=1 Tax=Fluctibacter halophilus TaxID=226011 RepID=A0ABS8G5S2_9ALTE|nr:CPXCG motif-containing cysteine-rich protein [Aestuariibacter halophilus]MCC2615905.1 CPXCG motif-containing cysteine-rich protein [Aestuariibacter halophilus]